MVAPTKNYSAILDAQLQSGKPVDQTLLTQIRDSIVFLKEWLGEGFLAGAAQNHNHDGVNSAAVAHTANADLATNAGYATHAGYADGTITWMGIGAPAWIYNNSAAAHGQGGLYSGSTLFYAAESGRATPSGGVDHFMREQITAYPASNLSGTWMCVGYAPARYFATAGQIIHYYNYAALYVKVA